MKRLDNCYKYVITTYITFWLMVLVICGGASMVFHASPVVMRILSNVCAWSPTFVLLVMFRKLRPHMSIKDFYREAFRGKIHIEIIAGLIAVISGGTCLSVVLLSLFQEKSLGSYFSLGSYSLTASFLFSLLSGPTGEESGWRGYLRVELNRKYSFMKSSMIQGVIWAFWHTVLWFVDSDFMGFSMIPYIISNVIVMTSLALIMNIILEKYNNLFYAVAIHFAFNFVYCFLTVDIWFYVILTVVYVLIALMFLCFRKASSINISKVSSRE